MSEIQKVQQQAVAYPVAREDICTLRVDRGQEKRARAQLKVMQQRGEIGDAFNDRYEGGRYAVDYVRLRQPRSRMPLYAFGTATAMGLVVGAGVLLWQLRYALLAGVALVLFIGWIGTRLLGGHNVTCSGIHCSGCRG